MPRYVTLINWTDKGIRNMKESPKRAKAAIELAESEGGKLTLYYTFGRYDMVGFAEVRDDGTMNRILHQVAAQGNIRTETLKAMSDADVARMFGKRPKAVASVLQKAGSAKSRHRIR
jgi:uncharacterized protein with GYD domain